MMGFNWESPPLIRTFASWNKMQNPSMSELSVEKKEEFIEIFGAREHNLKNIDINIPRNKLVVITGLSGIGNRSLGLDTN